MDHPVEVVVVVVVVAAVAVVAVANERNHHPENDHWLVECNWGSPDDQTKLSP